MIIRRSQLFGWWGAEQSSTGNTQYWPKTWAGKNRKKASVGGAGQERGRSIREEIKTINRRLVLSSPEATVGSLDFSLKVKQGTNGLQAGKIQYLIQIWDTLLKKKTKNKSPGLVDELDAG